MRFTPTMFWWFLGMLHSEATPPPTEPKREGEGDRDKGTHTHTAKPHARTHGAIVVICGWTIAKCLRVCVHVGVVSTDLKSTIEQLFFHTQILHLT